MSESTQTQKPDPMGAWLERDLFDELPEGLPPLEDEDDDE